MSFTVTVADLDQSAPAEPGDTVLSALLNHGIGFAYSCQAGNCGTCKCELISGDILELEYSEHALSSAERLRNIVLACRAQVWSDVVVRRLDAEDFVVHPSRVLRCRVKEIVPATHDVLRLRLEILAGGPFTFSAGQFARLEFAVARGNERDYSMASMPGDEILEFHIRVMPQGVVSKRVAQQLRPGDEVRVCGPLGTAYLRAQHPGPILAVAGGTGLAPIRSILAAALAGGATQPVLLYFGVRAERDVYCEDELAQWQARHPNFKAHVVLSEPDGSAAGGPLARRTGLVTDALADDFADLAGFSVYVAGPPPMVDAVLALAQARGARLRDVHADAFYPAAAEPKLRGVA
ncbi:MAG TPA: 2Fe-2S iron-sulfur cluster-binding protein [Burkholderiales bacterium]|jgi:ferredoxin-NAD(P)+ reductase (naphthalene dioxygenase ferredoxin-specific)|nr:2Fe-2S iron-sulfur cluster-binding protein [Burkholderiales bacterium]